MAHYEKYIDKDGTLHVYHKNAAIFETSVEDGIVKNKKHTVQNAKSPYYGLFLQMYDNIPVLSISLLDTGLFHVSEFIKMENMEYDITREEVLALLMRRGITKTMSEVMINSIPTKT